MTRVVRRRSLLRESRALRTGAEDVLRWAAGTCDRIEDIDGEIQAFVAEPGRRERLDAEARAVLSRWPEPAVRPPLYGVPVGVKDIVRVAGLPTRAGARIPAEALAGPQAPLVDRLRQAGALVAGKTVTAEFAATAPGPTRNPHATDHTPGGSSSGSAAAVAAGMVALAIGTQTIGSIVRPAAYCGVTGFKPSHGRIPADGVIAHAPTLDSVGVLAAGLADVALAAAVLLDDWRTDVAPRPGPPVLGIPAAGYLDRAGHTARAAFAHQVRWLRAAGFTVRRTTFMTDFEDIVAAQSVLNRYEFARVHAGWFAEHGVRYRPETAAAVRRGQAIEPRAYANALRARAVFRDRLATASAAESVDIWISPAATGPAPEGLGGTGDPVMSLPWSYAGAPALCLPAGRTPDGLPLGLQCVAPPGADEELLLATVPIERALAAAASADQPG